MCCDIESEQKYIIRLKWAYIATEKKRQAKKLSFFSGKNLVETKKCSTFALANEEQHNVESLGEVAQLVRAQDS